MTFVCPTCKNDCRSKGTNTIGLVVQEYCCEEGWQPASVVFQTACLAKAEMDHMNLTKPIDEVTQAVIERKVYSAFKQIEKPKSIFSNFFNILFPRSV